VYNVALVDAHLGNLDQANVGARQILAWSEANSDTWMEMSACSVLGLAALSGGDPNGARPWLDRWWRASETVHVIDPGISRFHGDHIESLIGAGVVDAATAQTEILEFRAERANRTSALAVAARCRALLAATAGDQRGALVHLDAALAHHAACPIPFETARTLMIRGTVHRRAKEKGAAKTYLERARIAFDGLGAAAFSARATAELDRLGTRPPSSLELSATERRVAELAAAGLTNRQVAERCFMSPKTVEANLVRIYRKLSIKSRAELGARMVRDG